MTATKLETGAMGYAVLMIVVAAMMASETMNAGQAAWTLVPATLVMVFVALRHKRLERSAA